MCGAVPKYLSLGFILEEGLPIKELWEIIRSIGKAAHKADVTVATGDTKVVERGKGDKIFINTTGIGAVHPNVDLGNHRIQPGDKIFINGEVANHGIAILSQREGLEFETAIKSDTTNLNTIVHPLLDEFGEHIHLMRDPTRGGVATVLNEIARDCQAGIDIHEKDIPINEEVEGACEMLGLDPLYVANEGLFVCFVDKAIAEPFEEKLKIHSEKGHARHIGEVKEEHPGKVILHSTIGGKRVVNMLPGEQLPRIC